MEKKEFLKLVAKPEYLQLLLLASERNILASARTRAKDKQYYWKQLSTHFDVCGDIMKLPQKYRSTSSYDIIANKVKQYHEEVATITKEIYAFTKRTTKEVRRLLKECNLHIKYGPTNTIIGYMPKGDPTFTLIKIQFSLSGSVHHKYNYSEPEVCLQVPR